jgi:hypothetical protein
MSAAASDRDGVVAGALALQRVLALEGRNALARVELAASELDRFEVSPAIQDRIVTIRDAVGELDALLDKIERLADPARPETTSARTRPDAVLAPLLDRVAPALAARDVAIVVDGAIARAPVALPGAVLERLVLLWLRLAVAACAGAEDDAEAEPCVLRLASREEPGTVALILSPSDTTRALRPPSDRGQEVELDVALAEWRALAQIEGEEGAGRWTLRLPRSDGDA